MALEEEIEKARSLVKTDAYQLSIGEIINMYRDKEIVVDPDFQRLFRWDVGQKSRLIESLLLGIPIPSIFVFERDDSKWELVDGLQRVSTLLEFMGLLLDPDTKMPKPPSALVATKYLPSLANAVWDISPDVVDVEVQDQRPIGPPFQLALRRSRLNVEILKRPSSNSTKYELFQRLNAGGTQANPQELRKYIIIMVSPPYSHFVKDLAGRNYFLNVLAANEEQLEKQRHMEYVCRFLVHTSVPYDNKLDVEEYIDEGMIKLATANEQTVANSTFTRTFEVLNAALGGNALRRLTPLGDGQGRVSLAAFECIAVGIARNIAFVQAQNDPPAFVKQRVVEFWQQPNINQFLAAGLRGTTRIQRTVPFGADWFSHA